MGRLYLAAIVALPLIVSGCASPYFVHDPQLGPVSSSELPGLLKSVRCELATYVAANNQRHAIYNALSPVNFDEAVSKYSFFELDPRRWGSVALDLKIQDTVGTQSGTAFDWKRTAPDKVHSHFWHIGPTLGDQNTYQASWSFVVPQDILYLNDTVAEPGSRPFQCYNSIPTRPNPPFKSEYTANDFDVLAYGTKSDYAEFTRVRVNGNMPLAGWLLDIGNTIGKTTAYTRSAKEAQEHMLPAQMAYTFTIQVTAGIDVKYGLTSTLWSAVAGEAAAGVQHTSTLTLTLDGVETTDVAGVKTGQAMRPAGAYTPLPDLTPRPAKTTKVPKGDKIIKDLLLEKSVKRPATSGRYGTQTRDRGYLIYPLPLIPPGPLQ